MFKAGDLFIYRQNNFNDWHEKGYKFQILKVIGKKIYLVKNLQNISGKFQHEKDKLLELSSEEYWIKIGKANTKEHLPPWV